MTDSLEELVSRYLDGTADADAVRRLDERLREDPAARRELFLAAAQDAGLRECLAAKETVDAPRRWRFGWLAAAAAALLAVGLPAMVGRYPQPKAWGAYRVVGGGPVRRGAVIQTDDAAATLALGGYCSVDLDPASSVRIGGGKRDEEVFLERGRVVCRAERGVGTFAVRTDVGTVEVTGTQFEVAMIEDRGDENMFGRQMAVRVLAGAVFVSGAWGQTPLLAGAKTTVPGPQTVLSKIVADLGLPAAEQRKIGWSLTAGRADAFRAEYRTAVRGRLFTMTHRALSGSMPKIMPTKIRPKIQAIRMKLRAGPPSAADLARIRMAMQKRTREIMMKTIHKTADDLADEAAADDRLVGWLLSAKVRAKLPGEKITAFDAAVKEAGFTDREPAYFARAKGAVELAIKDYDPDLTGIVDLKTGRVIVTDAQLGLPSRDAAQEERIAKRLRGAIANLDLPKDTTDAVETMLTGKAVQAERLTYCAAVRTRLFAAARDKQQAALPQKMPGKVQSKVMAIRTRLKLGGPPSKTDIARIQRAAMKRTRPIMMQNLHGTADAVAVAAAKDEQLVTAALATKIQTKLPADKRAAFQAAIEKAGITADESAYLTQAEQRIMSAIEGYDPDITGIVDPSTGKVIVKDEDK